MYITVLACYLFLISKKHNNSIVGQANEYLLEKVHSRVTRVIIIINNWPWRHSAIYDDFYLSRQYHLSVDLIGYAMTVALTIGVVFSHFGILADKFDKTLYAAGNLWLCFRLYCNPAGA